MVKKSIRGELIVSAETIENKIFFIKGKKVIIDRDLAKLYDVETKALNQAVKRNSERFPEDFMFQLSGQEFVNWKSQIVTSNSEKMGLRKKPYVFTEHGILMLSSVLNSSKAVQVNIQIMRIFLKLRRMLASHVELKRKIEEMERKYDKQFAIVFQAIKQLLEPPRLKPKTPVGFHSRT